MDAHTNFAYSAVATAPSPATSGTSLTVASGDGALFPAAPFQATVWAAGVAPLATNAEIVRVTAVVGDVFTIVRARESTVARTIVVGDQIAATITAQVVTDIENAIPAGLLSAINVSAGAASANLSALTFSNASGVSFGLAASVITASVRTDYQSAGAYLTTARASTDAIGLNTAGSNLTWTANSSGLSIDARGYAGTGTSATNASLTLNSAGLAISVGAGGHNVTLAGNTAGVLAEVSTGTLTIAGGNNITVSQVGNAITISGPNAGGAQTGISGLVAAGGTITSGTASFSNLNGVSFGVNGQTITASVETNYQSAGAYLTTQSGQAFSADASSTFQTLVFQDSHGVSFSNNAGSIRVTHGLQFTSATSAITSAALHTSVSRVFNAVAATNNTGGGTASLSSDVSFSAANGLTFYTSAGNAIVGSHNGLTTARASSDAIGLNTAQSNVTWTVNSSGLSLDARGYAGTVTGATGASLTVNSSGVSVNLPAYISTQSTQFLALTLGGNTAGTTTFHATNNASLFLNGGNNITLSGNGSTVMIVGPSQTNQSAIQAFGVSNTGTTAGNTGVSTGIDFVLAASGNITASQSTTAGGPNTVWLSVPAQTVQTQSLIQGIYDGAASITTGTIRFTNANGVTFTINGQTLSGSVATTYLASNASTNYVQANAAFAGTNASGTIASSGISVNVPATLSGYALGNTTGQSSSSTAGFSNVSFSGAGIVSLGYSGGALVISASAAPSPIVLSAGASSASISSVVFSNSNGISFGLSGSTITGSANTLAVTTVGTATTVYSVASANSVGTVTRWAAEDHRHAGIGALGISTSGNTAGTTGSVQGTYWVQGGNSLTVSQITSNNGSHTLVLSVGNYITTARASTDAIGLNTANSNVTWTANSSGLSLDARGYAGTGTSATNASVTLNSNGLAINVPFGTASFYANINDLGGLATGASAITQTSGSSVFVQPFEVLLPISAGFVRLNASFNDSAVGTAGTTSNAQTYSVQRYTTVGLVLYSQGVGGNSRSIQSVTSTSAGLTGITQYGGGANGSNYTITISKIYPVSGAALQTYTTSYAVSSASIVVSSNSNTLFTGPRYLDISWAGSLSPGNYWLGIGASTSSTTNSSHISFAGTAAMPISLHGVSQTALSFGVLGAATSASDHALFPGLGVWTTNASIWSTGSIALSQVSQVVSNPQLPFQIIRSA